MGRCAESKVKLKSDVCFPVFNEILEHLKMITGRITVQRGVAITVGDINSCTPALLHSCTSVYEDLHDLKMTIVRRITQSGATILPSPPFFLGWVNQGQVEGKDRPCWTQGRDGARGGATRAAIYYV